MNTRFRLLFTTASVAVAFAAVNAAFAQDSQDAPDAQADQDAVDIQEVDPDALDTLAPLTVVGSEEDVFTSAGSAVFVPAEEIRRASASNINQVLAKVPGAYVREEDGYGSFPNISLRGGDGTRSAKVTIMEDGILTAPAPYSAPAAYYSPRVARMSGLEILKGSSQVRFGPQSTGGVINYLSTPIPDDGLLYSKFTYGSDNTFFSHSYYGDWAQTEAGVFGYVLEVHGNFSDGFRDIDGFSRNTGFDLVEPMLKLSFEPNTALKQRFEFKAGYTSFDANETYVGLKENDLKADPNLRYAGTFADEIETDQYRTYLKWVAEPSDAVRVESAAYYNSFERDWFKADRVNGRNIHEVLAPSYRPADAAANSLAYDVLRGIAPGPIRVKGNAREYEGFGWQNQVNWMFDTGAVNHDLALGLRIHQDQERRDQYTTTFQGDGFGRF
ncbi:MAG TPA: TonB-dependent receptor plug domain-containing protein, partial [Verrucomicrobiales bacterium]|nr:TonB-dependent receptor plug domain-containing protein [Verrucomicrobiales bacterium]